MKDINQASLREWLEDAKRRGDVDYIIVAYDPNRDINRPTFVLKCHGHEDQKELIDKLTNGHPQWARVFEIEDVGDED